MAFKLLKWRGYLSKVIERSSQVLKSLARKDNVKRYLNEDNQMAMFENNKNFILKKLKI